MQFLNTTILDVNWKVITTLHKTNYLKYTPLSKIPDRIKEIFVAVEDGAFYYHPWFNPFAIFRAGIANIKAWRVVQWWSTITQQIAKLLIIWDLKQTLPRKILEAVYAVDMCINFDKDQVLETWLNALNFWYWVYWISSAAKFYFWKRPDQLNDFEIVALLWTIQSPKYLNPLKNPKSSLKKRNTILKFLYKKWLLSNDKPVNHYLDQSIDINKTPIKINNAPYAVNYISIIFEKLTWMNIKDCWCEVGTTIDLSLTEIARHSLRSWYTIEHVKNLKRKRNVIDRFEYWTSEYDEAYWDYEDAKKRLRKVREINGWMVVTNPHSWEIRVMIWWMSYDESQYSRVFQALRQIWI